MDDMPHLDEGQIHAWLDGAVDDGEAARIEAHVAACAVCAAEVATARGLIAGASRILLALDSVPGGVIPAQAGANVSSAESGSTPSKAVDLAHVRATRQSAGRHLRWLTRPSVRIAAGLLLAVGIGAIATRDDDQVGADRIMIDFKTEPADVGVAVDAASSGQAAPATPAVSTAAAPVSDVSAAAANRAFDGRTPVRAAVTVPDARARARSEERAIAPTAPAASAPTPRIGTPAAGAAVGAVAEASPPPPALSGQDSSRSRIGQNSLRLSEVVVTGAADPTAGVRMPFSVGRAVATGDSALADRLRRMEIFVPPHLGGACFALEAEGPADATRVPLIPRSMRIQLAEAPGIEESIAQQRVPARADNLQADLAAKTRQQSAPPASRALSSTVVVEPSSALAWQHIAADSVTARWTTAGNLIVFRLGVAGDRVSGTAAVQGSVAQPTAVSGRKVACGG